MIEVWSDAVLPEIHFYGFEPGDALDDVCVELRSILMTDDQALPLLRSDTHACAEISLVWSKITLNLHERVSLSVEHILTIKNRTIFNFHKKKV